MTLCLQLRMHLCVCVCVKIRLSFCSNLLSILLEDHMLDLSIFLAHLSAFKDNVASCLVVLDSL